MAGGGAANATRSKSNAYFTRQIPRQAASPDMQLPLAADILHSSHLEYLYIHSLLLLLFLSFQVNTAIIMATVSTSRLDGMRLFEPNI